MTLEIPPATPQEAISEDPAPKPVARRHVGSLSVGIGMFVAGLVLAIVALVSMPIDWNQLWVFLIAAIGMYLGIARIGKWIWGRKFDLLTWFCVVWLVLIIGSAILAPILPLQEYKDIAKTLAAPVMQRPDVLSPYLLGTNNFGLDLLARVIYGARASLVVSLLAVLIGMVIGGTIGLIAGFFRRTIDTIVGILTNSLLAIPPLILLIALATVLPPNIRNLAFALSLLALPSMIRMARANTLNYAQREFVLAARSMGATNLRLMFREILPNLVLPLMSYAMVIISALIVAESSLSFLGLGIKPPDPSWGNMIAEGEGNTFRDHPHIVLVPGAALFLTVFSFNMLGEKARVFFDSRQAKV